MKAVTYGTSDTIQNTGFEFDVIGGVPGIPIIGCAKLWKWITDTNTRARRIPDTNLNIFWLSE